MKNYKLTVFDVSGEKLLDETIQAETDDQAKTLGTGRLEEKGFQEHTHRCTAPTGKLVLFHR